MADSNALNSVELEAVWMELDADGILQVELKSGATFDVAAASDYAAHCRQICADKPRPFLVVQPSDLFDSTPEARAYLASNSEMRECRAALAIVATDVTNRLAATAYLNFNKPATHGRMFDNKEEARNWLREFL